MAKNSKKNTMSSFNVKNQKLLGHFSELTRNESMQEYILSDDFKINLNSYLANRNSKKVDNKEAKKGQTIEERVEERMKNIVNGKIKNVDPIKYRVINSLQKQYGMGAIKQNYAAFRTFSLDARDLAVMDEIEEMVDGKVPSESEEVMKELAAIDEFLAQLPKKIKEAKKERDIKMLQKYEEACRSIFKAKKDIERELWGEKSFVNPIDNIDI